MGSGPPLPCFPHPGPAQARPGRRARRRCRGCPGAARRSDAAAPDAVRAGALRGRAPPPRRAHGGGVAPAPLLAGARSDVVASPLRSRAAGAARSRALAPSRRRSGSRARPRLRVHRGRPPWRRAGSARSPLPRRPAACSPSRARSRRRTIPRSSTTAGTRARSRAGRRRGLRGRLEAEDALRVPQPRAIAGRAPARAGREPAGCDRAFPARHAPPRLRPRGRRRARVAGGASAGQDAARPPPQPRAHAAPAPGRRGGRAGRLHGGDGRGSGERRPLPGRRPGPEPARPAGRGAHRGPRAAIRIARRCRAICSSGWPSRSPKRPRAEEAKALLAGRFFAREEGGTNVRQVFVEIRLQEALALARAGRAAEALAVVERLGGRGAGLPVHEGRPGRLRRTRPACSTRRVRSRRWRATPRPRDGIGRRRPKAASRSSGPLPYAYLAARRLGGADEAAGRARLESTLAGVGEVPRARDGAPRACVVASQGLMLRALGREEEARARFRRALLLPDQRLSHLVSRRALQGAQPF